MKKHQFSMTELCVIVLSAAILITVLAACGASGQENRTACLSNLKNLGVALLDYRSTYKSMPYIDENTLTDKGGNHHKLLALLYATPAASNPNLYICPAAKNVSPAGSAFTEKNNSYAYHMGKISYAGAKPRYGVSDAMLSDGFAGSGNIRDTSDSGWNHESAGCFVSYDMTANTLEGGNWPDQVQRANSGDSWDAFRLY